jgi:hypothetical protein
MDYDRDKLDEVVLALLHLNACGGGRAWKGLDWGALDRLHAKGLIGNQKSKAKSVILTEEGMKAAEAFFEKHFCFDDEVLSPKHSVSAKKSKKRKAEKAKPAPRRSAAAMKRPSRPKEEPEREERIINEIVVDAYGEEERAMGWYYYLEEKLASGEPTICRCFRERPVSPLQTGNEVEVLGLLPEEECEHDMLVKVRMKRQKEISAPLSQLQPVTASEETAQAIEDWLYWVDHGYQF